MSVDSISLSWPVTGLVAHHAVVTCSQMMAWLCVWQRYRVFEKSSRSWQASIMWSNGALHPSSKVGTDHPAEFDSGGVHVTGRHDEKPYRKAGENPYLAGASCADDSPAQLKSERDTGSVVESGMNDSKDKATPQRDNGLTNNDALSVAGDSAALILSQGTNSPRGISSSLDLPMEREYPPEGNHSGMVSSLVSRWESESRSQSSGQGAEPSSSAAVVGPQLSRSQEDWASNTEAANTSVSTSVSVSNDGKRKAFPDSSRRRAARKAKSDLQDGYSSLAATLTQVVGRVDPSSGQARKVRSMAKLLLEDYQRDGKVISGV